MSELVRSLAGVRLAVRLICLALADAVRRRGHRVRRYASEPRPARPSVATGPIPIVLPSMRTGVPAPPLPPRPVLARGSLAPVVPFSPRPPGRHRARTVASRRGLVVLLAIAHHAQEQEAA
jgi:hypothetical protein